MQLAADAREHSHNHRFAALMALIANCNRNKEKQRRAFMAWDFWHRPGEKRPRSGNALTVEVLHQLGPAIANQ